MSLSSDLGQAGPYADAVTNMVKAVTAIVDAIDSFSKATKERIMLSVMAFYDLDLGAK